MSTISPPRTMTIRTRVNAQVFEALEQLRVLEDRSISSILRTAVVRRLAEEGLLNGSSDEPKSRGD